MSDELYGHDDSADLASRHRIDDSRKYPAQHPCLLGSAPRMRAIVFTSWTMRLRVYSEIRSQEFDHRRQW